MEAVQSAGVENRKSVKRRKLAVLLFDSSPLGPCLLTTTPLPYYLTINQSRPCLETHTASEAASSLLAIKMASSSRLGSTSISTPSDLWQRLESRRPLPLRFVLHLSRRPNASLCPCLELDLPSLHSPSITRTTVTRILDPEHRVPYISLSPLFTSAGLTLIQGLLRFSLSPTSFDLSLAGLEPWDDCWISLPLARHIANQLGVLLPLSAILDSKTALAWSLDEFGEGLSHNWRVPQEWVDAAGYSTDAITHPELRFGNVQLLKQGQQIKTLVSAEKRSEIKRGAEERRRSRGFRLRQKLVRWSKLVYEVWWELQPCLNGKEGREEEGEEGRHERLRSVLEDLRQVVVPPTNADVLEWMQLLSSPNETMEPSSEGGKSGEDFEQILSPMTLAELSQVKSATSAVNDTLPWREDTTIEENISALGAFLRAKLSMLHRMNLLSLCHLSTSADESGSPQAPISTRLPPRRENAPAGPPYATVTPADRVGDLASLNAKVDKLTAKLDEFISSSSRTTPDSPASMDGPESASGAALSAQPSQAELVGRRNDLSSSGRTNTSMRGVESKPSLVAMTIAVALAVLIIKISS